MRAGSTLLLTLLLLLSLCCDAALGTPAHGQAQPGGEPAPGATAASAPSPEQDARARELYLHGDQLYAEGDYGAAIEAFREAYELSGRALLLFNLANAHERAGQYVEAAAALRRYQPHAAAAERDSIARRILHLDSRAAPPGSAAQASASGTAPAGSDAAQEAGTTPPPATHAPATLPEPSAVAATSRDAQVTLPALLPIEDGPDDTLAWVLTGSGAGLLVLGGVAASVAAAARLDAEDLCASGICQASARDAIERDETFSILADVGFVAGGVALGTGIVLLLLHEPARPDQVQLRLGGERVALSYTGNF